MYHFVKCGGCLNSSLLESSICLLHSFLWWEWWKHEERRWEENWGCINWNNEEGKARIRREDWEILPPQKISYHDLLGHPRSSLFNKLISSSTNILKGQKIHSSSCCEKKIKKLGSKVQMLHISVETCDKRCRKSFSWYYLTVYVASVQPTPELCRCRMLYGNFRISYKTCLFWFWLPQWAENDKHAPHWQMWVPQGPAAVPYDGALWLVCRLHNRFKVWWKVASTEFPERKLPLCTQANVKNARSFKISDLILF